MRFKFPDLKNSLHRRVVAALIGCVSVSAALAFGVAVVSWPPLHRLAMQDQIEDSASFLIKHIQFDKDGQPVGLDTRHAEFLLSNALRAEMKLRVLNTEGRVVLGNDWGEQDLIGDSEFVAGRHWYWLNEHGVAMHGLTVPFEHEGQQWILQIAASESLFARTHDSARFSVLLKASAAIGGTFLVTLLVSTHAALRLALKPIRPPSSIDAGRIAPLILDARLPVDEQPLELQPLVAGFNNALDRMQRDGLAHRELLRNAAHELDVSVELIKAQVDLADAGPWKNRLVADVNGIVRQIDQLGVLAKACDRRNYRLSYVDPSAVINEAMGLVENLAAQNATTIGLQKIAPLRCWCADRYWLLVLLQNLLDCAIQHSPTDGLVTLVASSDGFTILSVWQDTSHGVLQWMFARYWNESAPLNLATAIGLTTCLEIAETHGWSLDANKQAARMKWECRMKQPPNP